MFRAFRKTVFRKRPLSVSRFIRNVRRRRVLHARKIAGLRHNRFTNRKRYTARQLHNELLRLSQTRGIKLRDGSLANLENRWVRKKLFRAGELYMNQINAKIAAKKAETQKG